MALELFDIFAMLIGLTAKRSLFPLNQTTVKYWNLYCLQYMFNT